MDVHARMQSLLSIRALFGRPSVRRQILDARQLPASEVQFFARVPESRTVPRRATIQRENKTRHASYWGECGTRVAHDCIGVVCWLRLCIGLRVRC